MDDLPERLVRYAWKQWYPPKVTEIPRPPREDMYDPFIDNMTIDGLKIVIEDPQIE